MKEYQLVFDEDGNLLGMVKLEYIIEITDLAKMNARCLCGHFPGEHVDGQCLYSSCRCAEEKAVRLARSLDPRRCGGIR